MADTNIRHASKGRGELTRSLCFKNLALLPADVTPNVGPEPVRAQLVTWR